MSYYYHAIPGGVGLHDLKTDELHLFSFHTRENRGFSTVKSTQRYVLNSITRHHRSDDSPILHLHCYNWSHCPVVYSGMPFGRQLALSAWQCTYGFLYIRSSPLISLLSFQVYVLQTFFTKTGRRYKV